MIGERLHRHPRVYRFVRSVWRRGRSLRGRLTRSGAVWDRTVPAYPELFHVTPEPDRITGQWTDPPITEFPFSRVEARTVDPPTRYDLALFEALNAEYLSHPVARSAPKYDSASIAERSRRRIAGVHDHLDLRGRTVLEVGCGTGYEVWHLAHQLGCDAWGIDIAPRQAWSSLEGERVHLVAGDIASGGLLPADTFERVMSFTVWEHIKRPVEAIAELARVMRPGGLAWIRANLYRGPTASHRTRDIAFPFPHLLFGDDVIDEAMRRAGKTPGGSAWVNRLTWEQYESAFLRAGFRIRSLRFTRYPLDEGFYRRFEDVLGRYPRADLERGFFEVVLEKP